MSRRQTIDRHRLLDEAEAILSEQGPQGLSLSALAARAGVSKGGVQYAFGSKEGLLAAILERLVERVQGVGTTGARPSERFRSWLAGAAELRKPSNLHMALLVAVTSDPQLLAPIRAAYNALLEDFADADLPLPRVRALALALDGLNIMELLGLVSLDAAEREAVVREILALATGPGER